MCVCLCVCVCVCVCLLDICVLLHVCLYGMYVRSWFICQYVCVCVIARCLCDEKFVFMHIGIPVCMSLYVFICFCTCTYTCPLLCNLQTEYNIIHYSPQRFYIPTSRQLKRIESTTRSPIYVHFSETVTGASTIRAYNVQRRFITTSMQQVDHNLVFYFSSIASNR